MITSTPILSAANMKAWDAYTITQCGIPSRVLMERAAHAVANLLLNRRDLFPVGPVVCLCGPGNNGGDGFAVARFLLTDTSSPRRATVLYTGHTKGTSAEPDTARMSLSCAEQYQLAVEAGVEVLSVQGLDRQTLDTLLTTATAAVDALFGIGLDRAIEGHTAQLMKMVIDAEIPTLAVDIPSGIHADTGHLLGVSIPARATVTMQVLKPGLLLYPGADYAGEVTVADIGITSSPDDTPDTFLADETLLRQVFQPRARRSHKGTYGKIALVCGSTAMSGAAILSARAALRSGAGLCVVITPEANRNILAVAVPEAIIKTYPTDQGLREAARAVQCALAGADAIVIGCGLSTDDTAHAVLGAVLSSLPRDGSVPLIIDADGLNLLASDPALWADMAQSSPAGHVVLTPHPTEMARLCGSAVSEILADLPGAAQQLATETGAVVVLKDAHTVIADPDGTVYISVAGNAGMASGGSGDVLAGVIGALSVAPRNEMISLSATAAVGVFLHAAAADMVALEKGEYGLLASDIVEALPAVTRVLSNSRTVIRLSL